MCVDLFTILSNCLHFSEFSPNILALEIVNLFIFGLDRLTVVGRYITACNMIENKSTMIVFCTCNFESVPTAINDGTVL